uniref:Polyprotein allergen nematode domain-containing protein n=1 Tax=Plectus sambesii TaxID=2011161 RepID=A0A914W777_9BILA
MKNKVWEFYEAATGEVKTEATSHLKQACREFIKKAVGEEKAAELKALNDGGATKEELSAKADELIASLENADMKKKAEAVAQSCKVVFGVASRKMRRHEGHHDAWKSYLTWLTQEQKDELKTLKEGGADFDTLKKKVWEFYEAATGEVKTEATTKLQDACRGFIKKSVGDEKAAELKTLKESGATNEAMVAKVDELINSLEDPEMKAKAQAVADSCKVVFGVSSKRMRRGEGHGDAWKSYLTWLTQEQKDEIKALKEGGADFDTLKKKVWEYYEAASGDVKTEATTKLQDACRGFIKKSVGDEKAAELKALKESGASNADIVAKVDELIEGIADADHKAKAQAVADSCKVVFGVNSRRIRENYDHLKEHLDWLEPAQKAALKELKESGASKDQLKAKVMMFFAELPADKQEELKTQWKGKCISWVKDVASQEERDELKQLHEEKKWADLKAKIEVYIDRLDENMKQKVLAAREVCQKLFHVGEHRF